MKTKTFLAKTPASKDAFMFAAKAAGLHIISCKLSDKHLRGNFGGCSNPACCDAHHRAGWLFTFSTSLSNSKLKAMLPK